MKNLIALVGAADGDGNTSSMRVMFYIILAAVILPNLVVAYHTGAKPVWSSDDLEMLGLALGGKLFQNQQEAATSKTVTPPVK